MSRLSQPAVAAAALAMALLVDHGVSASAYDLAGHYYSAAAAIASTLTQERSPLPAQEAALAAFCVQLPDESRELDAATNFSDCMSHPVTMARWNLPALLGGAVSPGLARVITVQQLLHGLTGGSGDEVTMVAEETIRRLWDDVERAPTLRDRTIGLCALGFAFHLLGDSFAHRTLQSYSKNPVMYASGLGHAFDFHFPDYPFYTEQAKILEYASYLFSRMNVHFIPMPGRANGGENTTRAAMWDYYFHILDDAYWHDNSSHNFDLDQILSLQSDANYSNLYYDDGIAKAIRKLYLNAAPDFAYQPGRINFGDPEMLCNDYLQAQEKTVPGVKALECSAVWAAFRKRSLQAFQNPLHAGARAGGYIDFQYFDPRFGGRDDCADRNAVQIAQSKATKSWEGSEFGLAPGQPLAHTAAPPRAPAAAAQTSSRPSGRVALNRLTPLTRQTSWKSALAGVRQQPASKRRGL